MSTRERKIRFIREFGYRALEKAVEKALDRAGPDWLTDDQLDGIVDQAVKDWRYTERMNRRHRSGGRAA